MAWQQTDNKLSDARYDPMLICQLDPWEQLSEKFKSNQCVNYIIGLTPY